jgi:hypothetical protein
MYPYAVTVTEWRGAIVAGEGNGYHDDVTERWGWERISEDGGRTWRPITVEEEVATEPGPALDCVPDRPTHCYRVDPGHLRVEETRDGGFTWAVSWEVGHRDRHLLAKRYEDLRDPAEHLASRALVVQQTAAGHVVVVANGRDGYAVRDPAGDWERIGFGSDDPPRVGAGDRLLADPWPWGLAGAVLSLVVMAAVVGWRARRWLVTVPAAVLTGGFATLPLQGWLELPGGHALAAVAALLVWGAGTTAGATLAWALGAPPAPVPVSADLRHR